LCDEELFSSLVVDQDHAHNDCPGYDVTPFDTLGYYWDQDTGSNPQVGTFLSSRNSSNVRWQAPPCTGTVIIKLNVDDLPEPLYNSCPGGDGTRDDDQLDLQKTVNVVLPSGCEEGEKSASLQSQKVGSPSCPSNACGTTTPPVIEDITLEAKYNECSWVFQVSVDSTVSSGPCPGNYTEISWPIDTSVVTQDNYCDIVDLYWNGNGCGSVNGTRYSTSPCVQIHENCHFNIFNEYLDPNSVEWLLSQSSMDNMTIECGDSATTTCQAAVSARLFDITVDVSQAYYMAWTWMDPVEEEAQCNAEDKPCFREYAEQICLEALTRGWIECLSCP
jgi:hypothetical protein